MIRLFIHFLPHLAALALIALCLQLADWQSTRALEKEALLLRWDDAPDRIVETEEDIRSLPNYAHVTLSGQFDPERHIFLDNKTRQNHPGVHVFVPFALTAIDRVILVNRGWQPWLRHDDSYPSYATPSGEVSLSGRLSPPPSVGFQLGEAQTLSTDAWPNLMTYFDLDKIRSALGPEVMDEVLLLDPSDPNHLSKDPWPRVNITPEKHRAYAFQWLAIAGAIFLIWALLTHRFYWKKDA